MSETCVGGVVDTVAGLGLQAGVGLQASMKPNLDGRSPGATYRWRMLLRPHNGTGWCYPNREVIAVACESPRVRQQSLSALARGPFSLLHILLKKADHYVTNRISKTI